jgi:arsenate reductase (glutaredoxin)
MVRPRTLQPSAFRRYARAMPTPPAFSVQVFGFDDSRPTRHALRFFKERRIGVAFVDLARKPIARGELRRFVDRLGSRALLDETSRPYLAGGLAHLRMNDDEIMDRLLADNRLLRLPLVRNGNEVTAGRNEAAWTRWAKAG